MIPQKSFLQKKIDKGIELLEKKNFSKATEIFNYLKKNNQTKLVGLFFLGIIQIKKNNSSLAEEYFLQILEIKPNHEDAILNLAFIYFGEKKYEKSTIFLDKVIKINKNNLNAFYHKGLIYFYSKDYENAIRYFDICINLNTNFLYSYLNLGHIYLRIKDFKKAIYNYIKVLKIDPNNNTSKFNLSWCYYSILDFDNAFNFYEYRKEKMLPGEKLNDVKNKFNCEEWFGENLDNKNILILSEQGIGDNIQFFRYLFWLKEKFNVKITFYVDKKLTNLFKDTPFNIVSNLDNLNDVNYYQHLLSLPGIFYKEEKKFQKHIPYIKAEDNLDQKWKMKLENYKKPIIGLSWQGDQNFAFDSTRSIALSFFKDILKIDTFKFISLQKGFGSEQIEFNNFSENLIDLSNEIDIGDNSFEDTIAILVNIDFLITSDTAIAHLAGTLGVKTYLLLEHNPEWRWYIENEYKCFYPNLDIIQQTEPGNWRAVFENLKELLKNKSKSN
jgi:tetratricopeptide (TPR) repeat protein